MVSRCLTSTQCEARLKKKTQQLVVFRPLPRQWSSLLWHTTLCVVGHARSMGELVACPRMTGTGTNDHLETPPSMKSSCQSTFIAGARRVPSSISCQRNSMSSGKLTNMKSWTRSLFWHERKVGCSRHRTLGAALR